MNYRCTAIEECRFLPKRITLAHYAAVLNGEMARGGVHTKAASMLLTTVPRDAERRSAMTGR